MAKLPATRRGTVLAVDRDLSRVFDFDDATKFDWPRPRAARPCAMSHP